MRWLGVAHALWIVAVLAELAIFVPGVPRYYQLMFVPCAGLAPNATCDPGQLSPAAIRTLGRLGLSLQAYAPLALGLVLVVSLAYFAVGSLIAWRKWNEGMGLFVSLVLITMGTTGLSDSLVNALAAFANPHDLLVQSFYAPVVTAVIYLQWPAFAAFLLTFPTGRFAPRWSWLLLLPWVAVELGFVLGVAQFATTLLIPLALFGTLGVLIYRYRSVYTYTERQQTKWLVLSLAVSAALALLVLVAQALAPVLGLPDSPAQTTELARSAVLFLPLALAIGIAILRHRLYDIDLIIRLALVYGSLTVMLAVVYFGVVVGAQAIIQDVTGQQTTPPIVVVATTLLIAALFNPLRARLQDAIDRRFYRHRYDAARTLEAFGATLRAETQLAQLSDQLVTVVQETMQPDHVSLWLRPPRVPRDNA
jgi:hypothetical protein